MLLLGIYVVQALYDANWSGQYPGGNLQPAQHRSNTAGGPG